MNRFHVQVSVKDLDESIRFYMGLFGVEPAAATAPAPTKGCRGPKAAVDSPT